MKWLASLVALSTLALGFMLTTQGVMPTGGSAYLAKESSRSANVVLAEAIRICSTEDFDTATQHAVRIWNKSLRDTGAVVHNVFEYTGPAGRGTAVQR